MFQYIHCTYLVPRDRVVESVDCLDVCVHFIVVGKIKLRIFLNDRICFCC